jgi:hypothetical protein
MGSVIRLGPDSKSGSKSGGTPSGAATGSESLLTTRNVVIGGVVLAVIAGGLWFAFGRGGADQAASESTFPPAARVTPAVAGGAALPGGAPTASPAPAGFPSAIPSAPAVGAMSPPPNPGAMPPAVGMYGTSVPGAGRVQAMPGAPVTPRTMIGGEAIGNDRGISTAAGPPAGQ